MRRFYSSVATKKWLFISLIFVFLTACTGKTDKQERSSEFIPNPVKLEKQDVKTLNIGDSAPDFSLPDTEGKFHSLKDYKSADILVIIFQANHCPTSQSYEDRIIKFTRDYKDKGVELIAISPSSTFGVMPGECAYSDVDDSYEGMKIRARDKAFNFPYLYDGDNQAVTLKYGPTATPHAFVFNKERKLEYVGRVDAFAEPGTGNAEDLRAVVDAMLNGEKPEIQITKTFGCSIKWAWRYESMEKENKEWDAKEVTLNEIGISGIEELKKNTSDKLRLINVWATWCAPCVVEYPDLVMLQRIYGHRGFEFVSISADNPEKMDKTLDFLKKNHSAVQNYIFELDDKYALIEAIDTTWNGALPYTLLVEPGGKIVYSNQGIVDLLELKKTIVENHLIGRYF